MEERSETGQNKEEIYKMDFKIGQVTPNYILVEETKMKEIRTEAVKRAIKYEEKAWNSEKKIIVECIKDLNKKRAVGEESKREAARSSLLKGLGIEKENVRKERSKKQEVNRNNIRQK